MKKILILLISMVFVGCAKLPDTKLETAHYCIDSLTQQGATISRDFGQLQLKMDVIQKAYEKQLTLLFKKSDQVEKISSDLDELIRNARSFIITYDKIDAPKSSYTVTSTSGMKTYVFNVEIDVDVSRNLSSDEKLQMAKKIDELIREEEISFGAKLIRVKVIN